MHRRATEGHRIVASPSVNPIKFPGSVLSLPVRVMQLAPPHLLMLMRQPSQVGAHELLHAPVAPPMISRLVRSATTVLRRWLVWIGHPALEEPASQPAHLVATISHHYGRLTRGARRAPRSHCHFYLPFQACCLLSARSRHTQDTTTLIRQLGNNTRLTTGLLATPAR